MTFPGMVSTICILMVSFAFLHTGAEGRAMERNQFERLNGEYDFPWTQRNAPYHHRGGDRSSALYDPWVMVKREAYADMPWGRKR